MDKHYLLSIIVVVLSNQHVSGQNECTHEAVEDCTRSLKQYDLDYRAVFPQIYESVMDQLCDDHEEAERCLKPFRSDCDRFQRHHYKGLAKAYDFICSSSGRRTYFKHWYCLDDRKMLRRVNRCNNTYQDELRKTTRNIYKYKFREIKERRCKHLNEYLSCIKTAITEECKNGEDIAEWHYKVHQLALKYVAKEISCEIGEPLLTPGEIAGIVVGGVVFIVLVIVLIYFCTCNVRRYRRKKMRIANEQQSDEKSKNRDLKNPAITISPPDEDETETEYEEEDEEAYTPIRSPKSSEISSYRTSNGQLSSRTRESLKLQLPVTPTSTRKSITYQSDFNDDTISETSRSLPPPTLPTKKMRSKRGQARSSARESETETEAEDTLVKIF